jgi:hypothetical protein
MLSSPLPGRSACCINQCAATPVPGRRFERVRSALAPPNSMYSAIKQPEACFSERVVDLGEVPSCALAARCAGSTSGGSQSTGSAHRARCLDHRPECATGDLPRVLAAGTFAYPAPGRVRTRGPWARPRSPSTWTGSTRWRDDCHCPRRRRSDSRESKPDAFVDPVPRA